jgi:hypothetical protein
MPHNQRPQCAGKICGFISPRLGARQRDFIDAVPAKPTAPAWTGAALKRPGPLKFLQLLRTNPIAGLAVDHFERPFLTARTAVGSVAFVSDPTLVRQVLVEKAANYRRDRIQRGMLTLPFGDSLFVAEGEEWCRQRGRIGPAFAPKMVSSFTPEIAACATALVQRWQNFGAGCRIDLRLEAHRAIVGLLERTLFLGGIGRNYDEAISKVRLQFELTARVSLLDLLNMPRWIPRIGALRLRSVLIYFAEMAADVIAARDQLLASVPAVARNDVVDMLLAPDETRPDGRACRKEVAGSIFMLFAAGHENQRKRTLLGTLSPCTRFRMAEAARIGGRSRIAGRWLHRRLIGPTCDDAGGHRRNVAAVSAYRNHPPAGGSYRSARVTSDKARHFCDYRPLRVASTQTLVGSARSVRPFTFPAGRPQTD